MNFISSFTTLRLSFSLVGGCVALASVCGAQAQELSQVFDAPQTGTFFLLSAQTEEGTSAPYPFDPYGGTIPIYQVAGFGGAYLVADSAEDYALYQTVMRERRWSLYAAAYGGEGGMMMSSEEGAPEPPGGGEGGGEWGGSEFTAMVFGSNDLWLEITNYVNGTAAFIIHAPEPAAHDLFGTSNLNLAVDVPALSGTNWLWLWRAAAGETNLVITNLWADMGFFRLGTLLDSDADGLTDAYERLVSHTDPLNPDTDGDGLSDYYELLAGLSPTTVNPSPSLASISIPTCAVP